MVECEGGRGAGDVAGEVCDRGAVDHGRGGGGNGRAKEAGGRRQAGRWRAKGAEKEGLRKARKDM